ncbi:uncharacterized protein N0V89_001639 [Didymosphaeria variabile]|uniref:Uncharacterized protein n=1 Tax=Didymosphaeria variabile TaxID=1932322 RepID=A0A9W9CGX7_9PLEO|nr:uncharacterized protein N0V89_001639 [Didymosphaeria variabile]KAJ4361070.1 hypothetical protein N0V89_001639 [Didymosphaeria variabile]
MSAPTPTIEELMAMLRIVEKQRDTHLKTCIDQSDTIRELREEADADADYRHELEAKNSMLEKRIHELEGAQQTATSSDHPAISTNDNITATTSSLSALHIEPKKT